MFRVKVLVPVFGFRNGGFFLFCLRFVGMNFGLGFGARLGFSFWDVVLTLELRLAIEISHSPRVGDPNVVSSPNRQSHPQGVQNLLCSTDAEASASGSGARAKMRPRPFTAFQRPGRPHEGRTLSPGPYYRRGDQPGAARSTAYGSACCVPSLWLFVSFPKPLNPKTPK